MSKKDYQAIARALYRAKQDTMAVGQHEGTDGFQGILTAERHIADTLAQGNPRFNRSLFLEACETGTCRGMKG